MACMQQIKASCDSDFYEKEKTVSKGSQGYTSSEHTKHDHKLGAYSTQGDGYQAVKANTHQVCNPASANKHSNHNGHSSGHLSLTEKFTGMFGSTKPQQSSGCNTHGHQTSTHGHQTSAHGQVISSGHGNNHGHQASGHVVTSHGHNGSGSNTHGHQASSHIVASHGHNSSGCNTHGHSHHKTSSEETYEFEEKKKEYTSSKSGHKKKVEKKIKKKSSYKCSSSDSSDSD